ncbi:Hypothetical protein NTJ_05262 [Nesidiocoris tenuis]|uniref:Uncharacterized protein n=1 Tax=Nesidiocoris tenuis TaxID=355587 RepID=A0ABN7AKH1_9HEMI|nr:Hypothetical protein NTJ_05262 [Nesidiocoris tenuis]
MLLRLMSSLGNNVLKGSPENEESLQRAFHRARNASKICKSQAGEAGTASLPASSLKEDPSRPPSIRLTMQPNLLGGPDQLPSPKYLISTSVKRESPPVLRARGIHGVLE